MRRKIQFHSLARNEMADIAKHIRVDNPQAAKRFLQSVRKITKLLLKFPNLGSLLEFENSRLKDLRWFNVSKFENYVIFYRIDSEGIEIVRIIHGARDFPRLFGS